MTLHSFQLRRIIESCERRRASSRSGARARDRRAAGRDARKERLRLAVHGVRALLPRREGGEDEADEEEEARDEPDEGPNGGREGRLALPVQVRARRVLLGEESVVGNVPEPACGGGRLCQQRDCEGRMRRTGRKSEKVRGKESERAKDAHVEGLHDADEEDVPAQAPGVVDEPVTGETASARPSQMQARSKERRARTRGRSASAGKTSVRVRAMSSARKEMHHEADGEERHELGDHLDPQEDADPAQAEDERRDLARERVEAAEGEEAADENVHDVARRKGGERKGKLAVVAERLTSEAADLWVDAE